MMKKFLGRVMDNRLINSPANKKHGPARNKEGKHFLRFQIKKTDGINIKFKNLRATLSIVIDLSIDHIVEIIIKRNNK